MAGDARPAVLTETVGRWVGRGDLATVWTTRDTGATWTPYTFR